MERNKTVEWTCTYCGRKEWRPIPMGRPQPGDCPRRPPYRDGRSKPHSWVKNRTF